MGVVTRPLREIIEHYAAAQTESTAALHDLASRIEASGLAEGLHGWTSMFDLYIAQTEVTYPYDGPYLRISPTGSNSLEFRFVDTRITAKQWKRTAPATAAWDRLISFLEQLNWFVNVDQVIAKSGKENNN